MYEQYYGFRMQPFELTSNPRFLLLTPTHREALSTLEYGISARKSITVLIGEAGTGKTTLLRTALAFRDGVYPGTDCVYLQNPRISAREFYERLALDFDLGGEAVASKTILMRRLEQRLATRRTAGRTTALVVDEAHTLSDDLLEELRLLANIELQNEKLLPLVLAGPQQLADRLNEPQLRQLKQRVALRCRLLPLNAQDTATSIYGRVKLAGGDCLKIFTREAIWAVCAASGGIPRTTSVICDNALISGFALQRRPVTVDIIEEVCRDLDIAERTVAAHGRAIAPAATAADRAGERAAAAVRPLAGMLGQSRRAQ